MTQGLEEAEIAAFELAHGFRFPASWRAHLSGRTGRPVGDFGEMVRARFGGTVLLMQWMDLDWSARYEERFFGSLRRGFLPVAINGGGDYFVLDVNTGAIRYWDHERDEWDAELRELALVASDVDDLFARFEDRSQSR